MAAVAQEALPLALIYQSDALHQHLKQALTEFGARVVYETHAGQYDPGALDASGAQVVVINLDPDGGDEFEALGDLLLDETRRVIFNDGEVTSRLEGWDLARWTRHLAAKVIGASEVNPPRPEGAEAIPVKVKAVMHARSEAANEGRAFKLEGDEFAAAMKADTGVAMARERAALDTAQEAVRPDPRARGRPPRTGGAGAGRTPTARRPPRPRCRTRPTRPPRRRQNNPRRRRRARAPRRRGGGGRSCAAPRPRPPQRQPRTRSR